MKILPPDYLAEYAGRVCRMTCDVVGCDINGAETPIPAGSRVMVMSGDYMLPYDLDSFRFTVVLLTASGRIDKREVSYDGADRSFLEYEPGVVDWFPEHSNQAIAQGWEIFYRDDKPGGNCWELQAVVEEVRDRFERDEQAWAFVWRRAVVERDPLASHALSFLYYRSPGEYRKIRDYIATGVQT